MTAFRKAIVVGASSGIGEAVARRLHREGADVALVARSADALEKIAAELNAARPKSAHAVAHDVRDYDAVGATFDKAVAALGGIDFVLYAAGVIYKVPESEYDFSRDRETIESNFLGAVAWLSRAAAFFEAQRSGTIAGISSIAGERGRRGNPAYGASKAALTSYLESLRNRVARYGVSVVTVKPGFVDTKMTRGMPGLFWLVSPEHVAGRTLALARRPNASGFVPRRWALVAFVLKLIPSFLFRRLNI